MYSVTVNLLPYTYTSWHPTGYPHESTTWIFRRIGDGVILEASYDDTVNLLTYTSAGVFDESLGEGIYQAEVKFRDEMGAESDVLVLPIAPSIGLPDGPVQEESALPTPVVFPFSPDWKAGFKEALAYLTDVIQSDAGLEQRVQLREVPKRHFSFVPMLMENRESAYLNSLVWRVRKLNTHDRWYVPFWPDVMGLNAGIAIGATELSVNTAYMDIGAHVLLWLDARRWELAEVDDFTVNQILLAGPTAGAWPVNTIVVPAKVARMTSFDVSRPSAPTVLATVSFDLEVV